MCDNCADVGTEVYTRLRSRYQRSQKGRDELLGSQLRGARVKLLKHGLIPIAQRKQCAVTIRNGGCAAPFRLSREFGPAPRLRALDPPALANAVSHAVLISLKAAATHDPNTHRHEIPPLQSLMTTAFWLVQIRQTQLSIPSASPSPPPPALSRAPRTTPCASRARTVRVLATNASPRSAASCLRY